jgi:hypothetical protein
MRHPQLVALSTIGYQLFAYLWQLGDPGVLQEAFRGFSEKARTRGFASVTLVRFALIRCN